MAKKRLIQGPANETHGERATLQAMVGRFVCDSHFATALSEAIDAGGAAVPALLREHGYVGIHQDALNYLTGLKAVHGSPGAVEEALRHAVSGVVGPPSANPAGLY